MDNPILNLFTSAPWREIVFSLFASGVFAVWRPSFAKYVLLFCGSVVLGGCLSLRLGESDRPKQAPTRTEVTYIDREAIAR
jgi:hypothetical protein